MKTKSIMNHKVQNNRIDFDCQADYCIDWYETDAISRVVGTPPGL
jgi:hypothetical protein